MGDVDRSYSDWCGHIPCYNFCSNRLFRSTKIVAWLLGQEENRDFVLGLKVIPRSGVAVVGLTNNVPGRLSSSSEELSAQSLIK